MNANRFALVWELLDILARSDQQASMRKKEERVFRVTASGYEAEVVYDAFGRTLGGAEVSAPSYSMHFYVEAYKDGRVIVELRGPVRWQKRWKQDEAIDVDQTRRELTNVIHEPTAKQALRVAQEMQVFLNKQKERRKKVPMWIPKKRESMYRAVGWTSNNHVYTCKYMRGHTEATPTSVKRLIAAIDTYMKHSALVAPESPRNVTNVPNPLVLWRGVTTNKIARVGTVIPSNGGCYTAFSYDREVAEKFSLGVTLYRLQVDRIARGTPWIWFSGKRGARLPPRWKTFLNTSSPGESEVLLPPGYLKVLRVSNRAGNEIVVVDVAFFPRPQYVRRGALPRVDRGHLVMRTIGGHPLVTNNAAAMKNVEARRERVTAAATKRVLKKSRNSAAAMRA